MTSELISMVLSDASDKMRKGVEHARAEAEEPDA